MSNAFAEQMHRMTLQQTDLIEQLEDIEPYITATLNSNAVYVSGADRLALLYAVAKLRVALSDGLLAINELAAAYQDALDGEA